MKLRNKRTGEIVDTLCSYDITKGISLGIDHHDGNGFNIPITATMPPEAYTDTEVSKDLDICFGGEE